MEPIWGRGTAAMTVGFGPFPSEISEFVIPPTFAPFYHALTGMISVGKADPESIERHAKALARSLTMFVPGGLQLDASIKGLIKEGPEGLLKSVIRYKPKEGEEPFGGIFKSF